MSIGSRIRARRRALDLTQEALAEASGLRMWTVCNIERGRQTPSLATAARLAEALGCTVDALVAEAPPTAAEGVD